MKKILALLLVLALSLTLVAAMCLPFTAGHRGRLVAAASTVWSGGTAAEYAGGQGTQGDPYQIATGEQLALLVQTDATATAGKYYVLTEDIRLNDTSAEDWKQSATPWVQSTVSFRGQLDGQGHVVEGLFIDADYTILTVTDTGRGMSPDIRAHLFEKGVSTKGGEHGRGLFLVKELVEKYHGTIDVDTEIGEGTSITVSFQRLHAQEEDLCTE